MMDRRDVIPFKNTMKNVAESTGQSAIVVERVIQDYISQLKKDIEDGYRVVIPGLDSMWIDIDEQSNRPKLKHRWSDPYKEIISEKVGIVPKGRR